MEPLKHTQAKNRQTPKGIAQERDREIIIAAWERARRLNKKLIVKDLTEAFGWSSSLIYKLKNAKTSKVSRRRLDHKKKINDEIVNYLVEEGGNKRASQGGSITTLQKKVKAKFDVHISRTSISNHLIKRLARIRKVRKTYYINEENKKERFLFCQETLGCSPNITNYKFDAKELFFTDEKQFILQPDGITNDTIRLTFENLEKLKEGDFEVEDLCSRQTKAHPLKFMAAGGISYYGQGKLIFCAGMIDSTTYSQMAEHYKKDIEELEKISDGNNLLFQQDNASYHKSKVSRNKLHECFSKRTPLELDRISIDDDEHDPKKQIFRDRQDYLIHNWPPSSPVINIL